MMLRTSELLHDVPGQAVIDIDSEFHPPESIVEPPVPNGPDNPWNALEKCHKHLKVWICRHRDLNRAIGSSAQGIVSRNGVETAARDGLWRSVAHHGRWHYCFAAAIS